MDMASRTSLPNLKMTAKLKRDLSMANMIISSAILPKFVQGHEFSEIHPVTFLNHLIYSTAFVISERHCTMPKTKHGKKQSKCPPWQLRLLSNVDALRAQVSVLESYKQGIKSHKVLQKVHYIRSVHKARIDSPQDVLNLQQKIKMKMLAKAQRLKIYKKRCKQFHQNKAFKENAKQFYRQLNNSQITVDSIPDVDQLETYWKNIWQNNKNHNESASWITEQENSNAAIP